MNPEYEKQLEACVRRELEALGEMPAPSALAKRIMRAVEQRAAVPWYRRAWSTWPGSWQAAGLAALLLAFGGLCAGAWMVTHDITTPGWFTTGVADASAIWRVLEVLATTAASLIGRLGVGVLVMGAAVVFGAWVTCIGLGTAYVRLAMRPAVN
ncbi:MAG TPA: hypothetical protein VFZ59_14815 [Verrucomicrobiae bacterium]|nr:hypothetical protein [Verrucomicrobiae bacterium]